MRVNLISAFSKARNYYKLDLGMGKELLLSLSKGAVLFDPRKRNSWAATVS